MCYLVIASFLMCFLIIALVIIAGVKAAVFKAADVPYNRVSTREVNASVQSERH